MYNVQIRKVKEDYDKKLINFRLMKSNLKQHTTVIAVLFYKDKPNKIGMK